MLVIPDWPRITYAQAQVALYHLMLAGFKVRQYVGVQR